MKNKLVAGAVVLAGLGGVMALASDRGAVSTSQNDTDYAVERSYQEYGDKDCTDFSTQAEAQRFFEAQGGPGQDPHGLDRDKDGIACESI